MFKVLWSMLLTGVIGIAPGRAQEEALIGTWMSVLTLEAGVITTAITFSETPRPKGGASGC